MGESATWGTGDKSPGSVGEWLFKTNDFALLPSSQLSPGPMFPRDSCSAPVVRHNLHPPPTTAVSLGLIEISSVIDRAVGGFASHNFKLSGYKRCWSFDVFPLSLAGLYTKGERRKSIETLPSFLR